MRGDRSHTQQQQQQQPPPGIGVKKALSLSLSVYLSIHCPAKSIADAASSRPPSGEEVSLNTATKQLRTVEGMDGMNE